jgi:hypothetical protein
MLASGVDKYQAVILIGGVDKHQAVISTIGEICYHSGVRFLPAVEMTWSISQCR